MITSPLKDKMKLICLIMTLVTAAQALNSYVIIAPNTIRPGMRLRVMIHVFQNTPLTGVTISIVRNGEKVVSQSGTVRKYNPRMFTLVIPRDLQSGAYRLHATGRGGITFHQIRPIHFVTKDKSVFIQSDKAIYKPGDRVQFRALALYPTLKPYVGGLNISVYDSASNKIQQWMEVTGIHGVVGRDFELSSQPVLGDWKIQVVAGKQKAEKTITIAKYVLPKFQVEVLMPTYVVTSQEEIGVKVKSTYTYGKPVSGKMTIAAKLLYQYEEYESSPKKEFFNLEDDIEGEGGVSIPMSAVKKVRSYLNNYKLAIKATVMESVTGNIMTEYGVVTIFTRGVKLDFPAINPDTFKPGLLYTALLSVTQPDGRPLAVLDEEVEVTIRVTVPVDPKPVPETTPKPVPIPLTGITTIGPPAPTTAPFRPMYGPIYPPYPQDRTYVLKTLKLSVPGNGLAAFTFEVPPRAKKINLRAIYRKAYANKSLQKSHSPSNSYIQLSLAEYVTIKSGDRITFTVKATMPVASLVYQVISRGELISSGVVHGLQRRVFTFVLRASSKMAPNARLVVYFVRQDGEIVTDTIGFDVTGAFRNQVELSLSENEAEPGDEVRLRVSAVPTSHVFLLALDQSVLLLKSGNDITPNDVYDELEQYDTISHTNDGIFRSPGGPILADAPEGGNIRMERSIWWPYPIFYGGSDATKIFQRAGVIIITDALVYKYVPPQSNYPYPAGTMRPMVMQRMDESISPSGGLKEPDRIRTDFPETWVWTDIKTCVSGQATVVAKVPDSITSWIASAFAVHRWAGFGVAPTTSRLQVFKPFFVSLNLPYSVIRGEYVAIQAIVFNYMQEDLLVKVTLPRSYAYYNIYIDCNGVEDRLQQDQVYSIFVKAGQSQSVFFPIVPISIDFIDIEVRAQSHMAADGLRKQLLVEPEGVRMEFNQAVLIDLTSKHNAFIKTLLIDLPEDIVEGSALAKISAIGDIMGPSISGLEKLLRLPTGCGEQTLLSLAPDVYITEYLAKTNQLSGAISDKAISFMQKGYQQELTFKHLDGSFSAFGSRDKSGSMWLTAFVARVFHQASSHIFVDDRVIKRAISWMISKQLADGSFPEPGRVIHKNMQGRASSGVALTTFVLISLYENEDLYENGTTDFTPYYTARQKALAYVEAEVAKSDDLYLLAMASYTFQLAGSADLSDLMIKLSEKATREGGLTYWHVPEEKKDHPGVWHSPNQGSAIDTEVTSYVLLTLALRKDLGSGRSILQWVTQQRNPHGGFSSTQDTVVALQALSEFAELVYSDNFNIDVKVLMDEEETYTFNINQKNALVTQRRQTKFIPAKVEISAHGKGIALVELAVLFNVEREVEDTSYTLKVTILSGSVNHFILQVCTSRLGDVKTGMVVAEIGILSGFEVDESSITKLDIIKRTETSDRKVVLYFDEISSNETCVTARIDRVQLVAKPKPAIVRVYDYYEPSFQITGFYSYETLNHSTICDVCPKCLNCTVNKEKKGPTTPEPKEVEEEEEMEGGEQAPLPITPLQ